MQHVELINWVPSALFLRSDTARPVLNAPAAPSDAAAVCGAAGAAAGCGADDSAATAVAADRVRPGPSVLEERLGREEDADDRPHDDIEGRGEGAALSMANAMSPLGALLR